MQEEAQPNSESRYDTDMQLCVCGHCSSFHRFIVRELGNWCIEVWCGCKEWRPTVSHD